MTTPLVPRPQTARIVEALIRIVADRSDVVEEARRCCVPPAQMADWAATVPSAIVAMIMRSLARRTDVTAPLQRNDNAA